MQEHYILNKRSVQIVFNETKQDGMMIDLNIIKHNTLFEVQMVVKTSPVFKSFMKRIMIVLKLFK